MKVAFNSNFKSMKAELAGMRKQLAGLQNELNESDDIVDGLLKNVPMMSLKTQSSTASDGAAGAPGGAQTTMVPPTPSIEAMTSGWNDAQFEVDRAHTSFQVTEMADDMKLDGIDCRNLLQLFDKTDIPKETLAMYDSSYSGGKYTSKSAAPPGLEAVVNFCESGKVVSHSTGSSACRPIIKQKMRFVTKLLTEDTENKYEPAGIFLLLASHGNVCNLMKEVGVDMVYGLMTNSVKEDLNKQTMEATVLRLLRDLRYVLLEELYKSTSSNNNTHYIVHFNNAIAANVGLPVIPDPYTGVSSTKHNAEQLTEKFWKLYTEERIVKWISACMDDEPRKIPYQKAVNWFQKNGPAAYEFLSDVFDIDTGNVSTRYVKWMLTQLKIFTGPEVKFNYNSLQKAAPAVEKQPPAEAPAKPVEDAPTETATIASILQNHLDDVTSAFQSDVFRSMWLGPSQDLSDSLSKIEFEGVKV